MPKQPSLLERLSVSAPCSVDWDSMHGNEQVRFCDHCQKTVHNLSEMTRAAALKLVAESEGRLCVRYHQRPDGSIQTAPRLPPARLQQLTRRTSRAAAGAFTAALSLYTSAAAQTPAPVGQSATRQVEALSLKERPPASEQLQDATAALKGVVYDPQSAVVPGATVTLTNDKTGQQLNTTSSDEGAFAFQALEAGTYRLSVVAQGFKILLMPNIVLEANNEKSVDAVLNLGDVEIMGIVSVIVVTEPLVQAASEDNLDEVRALIAKGADVNARDKNIDRTALDEAVYHANLEMIQALISAGADVNARNKFGQTALLRMDSDADAEIVRLLVRAGAKVNVKDADGKTPLMYVARQENLTVLQALLAAGAKVDARNRERQTALMIAAKEGEIDNVKALLDAGADVNRRDRDGKTALKYAIDEEHAEIVELLKNYGAIE